MNWKVKLGRFLFKYRGFTLIPFILLMFLVFKPYDCKDWNTVVNLVGLFIAFLGQVVRAFTIGYTKPGTSGRENYLRADHLNMDGIYSLVRNPLYLGNFLIYNGLLFVFFNGYVLILFQVIFYSL